MVGLRSGRTRRQRVIEEKFGKPLAEVIRELLYVDNLTTERAADQLGVSRATLYYWRRALERRGVAA